MLSAKELRSSTGLSQSAFASEFNIPVRSVQQWEQGKSKPPYYVLDMLQDAVIRYNDRNADKNRHFIPEKTKWKVCIDRPFNNCERIYPIQQRKVREVIDDLSTNSDVSAIWIFGSSTTERCHVGSDVDVFVETDSRQAVLDRTHDFPVDLWGIDDVDDRLKQEIFKNGVKVYG